MVRRWVCKKHPLDSMDWQWFSNVANLPLAKQSIPKDRSKSSLVLNLSEGGEWGPAWRWFVPLERFLCTFQRSILYFIVYFQFIYIWSGDTDFSIGRLRLVADSHLARSLAPPHSWISPDPSAKYSEKENTKIMYFHKQYKSRTISIS